MSARDRCPRDAVTLPEIIIADYDPAWPQRFQEERDRIAEALRDVPGALLARIDRGLTGGV